jgi:hypothetical protein
VKTLQTRSCSWQAIRVGRRSFTARCSAGIGTTAGMTFLGEAPKTLGTSSFLSSCFKGRALISLFLFTKRASLDFLPRVHSRTLHKST